MREKESWYAGIEGERTARVSGSVWNAENKYSHYRPPEKFVVVTKNVLQMEINFNLNQRKN